MTIALKAEKREKIGKLDALRKKGLFPAVYYGKKEASTPIQIPNTEFLKAYKQAGESTVVSLDMGGDKVDALIHDVHFHPLTGQPVHADFYVFEKGHKVEISIPIEFIGESPAVKAGGVLVKVLHELKIKADPSNLPHQLEVDISGLLEIDHHISAGDIKLPSGVELMESPTDTVVSIAAPKEEKEEESAPIDLDSIEVEKKGKKEEEGVEGEAAPATTS